MIYIIGSSFSGLTTAFILRKKYKNITVISPSRKDETKKSATLLKYLLSLSGEIKFNSKKVSKRIDLIEKTKIKNCKFVSSYQEGGLSNIWGGVLSNIYQYNLKNFPFNKNKLEKIKRQFLHLEKIIFKKNFRYLDKNSSLNKNITMLNFNKKKEGVINLKKYLLNKNIKFKYDLYLKKINYKSKKIVLHDLSDNKIIKLNYKKLYISAGPINTAKIILNSFREFKKIKLYETRHFFCLVKKRMNLKKIEYFKFNYDGLKFYSQLYNFRNILNIFFNFKKFNLFKNLFMAQCYLNTQDSSYIEIKKDGKSNFLITGKQKKTFNKRINEILSLYNKKSLDLKFYFPIFNSIGASNHLGASFPMSKKKKKFKTKLNGELYNYKDIYLSDSSVLNEIDVQPITTFTLMNILRMNS